MQFSRRASLIFLVLALVAGSVSMATARHQTLAVGEVELCTTWGATTLLVDAEGKPTGPAHPCPDCTPAFAALTGPAAPIAQAPTIVLPLRWHRPVSLTRALPNFIPFRSRAPPVAV